MSSCQCSGCLLQAHTWTCGTVGGEHHRSELNLGQKDAARSRSLSLQHPSTAEPHPAVPQPMWLRSPPSSLICAVCVCVRVYVRERARERRVYVLHWLSRSRCSSSNSGGHVDTHAALHADTCCSPAHTHTLYWQIYTHAPMRIALMGFGDFNQHALIRVSSWARNAFFPCLRDKHIHVMSIAYSNIIAKFYTFMLNAKCTF